MPLAILSDAQIRGLLENLTLQELMGFHGILRAALHEYSTQTQSSAHQPERTSVYSSTTGATTLFMPSSSPVGNGVKVITLTTADGTSEFTNREDPPPVIHPTGAITLFSPQGELVGLLHASTLTAFRTALASLCLVAKRASVRTLTVFGCGEQAYWHVRLALLLRGDTIRQVNFVNRRFSPSCAAVLKRLYAVPAEVKAREGWTECTFGVLTPGYGEYERLLEKQILEADIIFCCTPATEPLFRGAWLTTHEARRMGRLIVAIGSYTPRMRELPNDIIRQAVRPHETGHRHFHKHVVEGGVVVVDTLDGALKEAGEIIDAGLLPTQVVELGELVMLNDSALPIPEGGERDDEITSETASTATVNSASTDLSHDLEKLDIHHNHSAMSNLFGVSAGGGSPTQHKLSFSLGLHRRSGSVDRQREKKKKNDALAKWLAGGNVIYKSVGLGLMDLTVGMHLVKFAREKGVGSHVEGF